MIVVKDVIQFFGSNIRCFEYLSHVSHVHQMFQGASHIQGNYSTINGLIFTKLFEKDYKYLFINFSSLQQEVSSIFELLNSTEQVMITTKFMTENQAYCGFQG